MEFLRQLIPVLLLKPIEPIGIQIYVLEDRVQQLDFLTVRLIAQASTPVPSPPPKLSPITAPAKWNSKREPALTRLLKTAAGKVGYRSAARPKSIHWTRTIATPVSLTGAFPTPSTTKTGPNSITPFRARPATAPVAPVILPAAFSSALPAMATKQTPAIHRLSRTARPTKCGIAELVVALMAFIMPPP